MESSGSAQTEFEHALDSIEKKIEGVKGQFVELVTDGGLTDFIKLLLDMSSVIMNVVNSSLGKFVIQVGLAVGAVTLLNSAFVMLSKSALASAFSALIPNMMAFISLTMEATTASGMLYNAMLLLNANPLFLIGTALVTVISLSKVFVNYIEKARLTLSSQSKYVSQLESEYEALNAEMAMITAKDIDELTEAEKRRLAVIEAQVDAKYKEIQAEKDRQFVLYKAGQKNLQGSVVNSSTDASGNVSHNTIEYDTGVSVSMDVYLQNQINQYDALQKKIAQTETAMDGLSKSDANYTTQLEELEAVRLEYISQSDEIYNELINEGTAISELSEASGFAGSLLEAVYSRIVAIVGIDKIESPEIDTDGMSEYALALSEVEEKAREVYDGVLGLEDGFKGLNDVVNDYNDNHKITTDSLDTLLNMDSDYLSLLSLENGQLVINKEASLAMANAKIDEAMASAIATAQAKINAIANGEMATSSNTVATASSTAGTAVSDAGAKALQSGKDALAGSAGWNILHNAMLGQAGGAGRMPFAQRSQIREVQNELEVTLTYLDSLRAGLGDYSSSSGGASKATDELTEAIEREKEALEDLSDSYNIVIDYVKDLLDEEQNAWEDRKDKILSSIKDEINALKDLKDADQDLVDARLEALEAKKKAEEDYYDNQLDKLNKENEAIEDNIELQRLQEQLANAYSKKVMVLEDGKFVYKADENAVSEAQGAIAEYKRNSTVQAQKDKIEADRAEAVGKIDKDIEGLENALETANGIYEAQIKDLEDYYDTQEKFYDDKIEAYDEYSKAFEDMLSAEADRQAGILYNQLVGEANTWEARLGNLQAFVNEYNTIGSKLAVLGGLGSSDKEGILAQMQANSNAWHTASAYEKEKLEKNNQYLGSLLGSSYNSVTGSWTHHADGIAKVKSDEIAIVGENPNYQELVIGAKYNSEMGVPTKLSKGAGVIPAFETKTLADKLTQLARGNISEINKQNHTIGQTIMIDKMIIDGVQNVNDFVTQLTNKFKPYMVQKSYN